MTTINKIKLLNFKRFESFEVEFEPDLNLLIGDNEAGKSSILTAIDLTIRGSRNKVEAIGLEHLFNTNVIKTFLSSSRKLTDLPELKVELFLSKQSNEVTEGRNNSDKKECDGIRLICKPNDDYSEYIKNILDDPNCLFPFEFYSIKFTTFSDIPYHSYNKLLKHISIDNSQGNSEYAMIEYIKDIYNSTIENIIEKNKHHHEYRSHKENYKINSFKEINSRLDDNYEFAIKSNSKSNLETDLTILDEGISIDNKGKGKQCIIKTALALSRSGKDLEIVLLEEPENHLSHGNMKKLIHMISESNDKQIFIATHSDLISTRLDLRKSILLNSGSNGRVKLKDLPESTAKFFIKAPDNNILEFILSKKVILVEGDAEFILADSMFTTSTQAQLDKCGIHVISVDGTSFARYLDIANLLKIKTAIITDNDGKYQANCIDRYSKYRKENLIEVFADKDDNRKTFEICMYQDNKEICDDLFKGDRKTLTVLDYMLKNKAEAAYLLLENKATQIKVPSYITEAFTWIKN